MRRNAVRKLIVISLPALVIAGLVPVVVVEVWVRLTWNPRRGSPGFYLSDPVRTQRLGPNYSGWFAGVPVRINALGFRDTREYDLRKRPNTFRILVLGDSVTFGHGSVYEHTYPYLLEQLLRKWRADVDWQVWNAAVPGYNTSQELAHLLDVGPPFQPDLVVVGFFMNDLIGNQPVESPNVRRIVTSRALSLLQRYVYSLEFYKRVYLTLAWRLSASAAYRQRFEHLSTEEALTWNTDAETAPEQQLTSFERLSEEQAEKINCVFGQKSGPEGILALQQDPQWRPFMEAIEGFQRLQEQGAYRIVFFLNYAPLVCREADVFYDGGSVRMNRFLVETFARAAPTVSPYDAFRRRRPSQMPHAGDHSIGNANLVKAEVLYAFLRDSVLPPLLQTRLRAQTTDRVRPRE